VTRNWLAFLSFGALAMGCAAPGPPTTPVSTTPNASSATPNPAPATADVAPDPAPSVPDTPADRYAGSMPPASPDANPPGTPAYVVAPGDPAGPRSAEVPRIGGRPAF
jgi:hypothetical protein